MQQQGFSAGGQARGRASAPLWGPLVCHCCFDGTKSPEANAAMEKTESEKAPSHLSRGGTEGPGVL